MVKKTSLLPLLFLYSLNINCLYDDCFLELPKESKQTTIQEVISDTDFSSFEILRSENFHSDKTLFPFEFDFEDLEFTLDNFSVNNSNQSQELVNYGPNITYFETKLSTQELIWGSHLPSKNISVMNYATVHYESFPNRDDTLVLIENGVHIFHDYDEPLDTLISYKQHFIDSTLLRSVQFNNIQFTKDADVFLTAQDLILEVKESSQNPGNYDQVFVESLGYYVLKVNSSLKVDTLYFFQPSEVDYPLELKVSKTMIFLRSKGRVFELSEDDRSLTFLYDGALPEYFSIDSKSLTS